jgi:hypothetical protein
METPMSEEHQQPAADEPVIHKRIAQFIKLRDKIEEIKKAHEEELKPYTEALIKLNATLLELLNENGGDSVTVRGVGTVYRSTKRSASIADGGEFRRFIIGGELWELVDWKANAAQIAEFIKKEKTMPPGVNMSSVITIGVRRA